MAAPGANLRIDGERLWQSLMDMARIGPGVRDGNNRQTLTDADREGRLLFQRWSEEVGMTVRVDAMGNMFARADGTRSDLAPVLVGSHLDTQPTGGRFDGVLGVLAALEIVRTLRDLDLDTERPIEVVNWTNEEGTRFAPAMVGSGVYAGVHDRAWAYERTDADGLTLGEELARIGFRGDDAATPRRPHAYFELHIEQGPILEREDTDIGIVTHGQGLRWLEITLEGRESHTGTTPMDMRRNAGLGMAHITLAVEEIARRHAPAAVGTIGHAVLFPNSRNIIPGRTVFTVDIRSPDLAVLLDMEAEVRRRTAAVAADLGLDAAVAEVGAFDPVTFDPATVATLRAAAERLGYRHRDIVSGAGHDACWINLVAPTAMVMCPCVDGLSHNEDEDIRPEWARAGADVLLHAVLETAGIAR